MNSIILKPAFWFTCDKCGRDAYFPKTMFEQEINGEMQEYYIVPDIVICPHEDCRESYKAEEWELSDD